jgi:hypothetical protein
MNKRGDDLIVNYVAAGGKVKNFVADWRATFSILPASASSSWPSAASSRSS